MSLLFRSLLNDPVSRPYSRAVRPYDEQLWLDDPWATRRVRRVVPSYGSPLDLIDTMNRNMALAINSMHDFADDLNALDSFVSRADREGRGSRRNDFAILKRTESGGLQLALDVAGYKPEELKINLVDDNLVVEAVSESSGEDSYHRNQFKRWFKLPEDCKVDEIRSKLTEDNKLLIDLPGVKPVEQKSRNIPIEISKSEQKQVTQEANQGTSKQGGDKLKT